VLRVRNCWATGSLKRFNPSPAFVAGKPTSQSRGKFTEIPRFPYMFVNLEFRWQVRHRRNNLAAVHIANLSPSPLGVEGPVPRTGPRGSTGLGWGI
jgi:hypothetical protein